MTIPNGAEVGDTLIVNGKEQTLTQEDIDKGSVTVPVDMPTGDGEFTVTAVIKDPAGHVSPPATAIGNRDTTAPSEPTITINDGDSWIGKDEISPDNKVDTIIEIPADAEVGDVLTVNANGVETKVTLTEKDINTKTTTVQVDSPTTEGAELTVTATITDKAGNTSIKNTDSARLDTTATEPPTIKIGIDGDKLIEETDALDEVDDNEKVDVTLILPEEAKIGDIPMPKKRVLKSMPLQKEMS